MPRIDLRSVAPATELRLLGGFELCHDGEPVALTAPARRLLAFLALQRRPVSRLYVSGVLWQDSVEERAAGNMRTALWAIRKLGAPIVRVHEGTLALEDTVVVDMQRARTLADRVLRSPDLVAMEPVDLDLLGADVLPDWLDDDFVAMERERSRQLRLHALETLSAALVRARRLPLAVQAALLAVGADPLRETANQALVNAYLAEGNRVEAGRHYRAFHRLLCDEIGLAPTFSLQELVAAQSAPYHRQIALP